MLILMLKTVISGYQLGLLFWLEGGVRVRRGYCREALMIDKPVDITHLVFVIHGIGQRMYAGSILKCCAE